VIFRSLIRIFAGLALTFLLAITWTSSSEAHGAHDSSSAQTHRGSQNVAGSFYAEPAKILAEATPEACAGYMGRSDGHDRSACCSNTCHAAMPVEVTGLEVVTLWVAFMSKPTAPPELAGPMIHIKRPPRSPAAPAV
jgi:hypothetical protein